MFYKFNKDEVNNYIGTMDGVYLKELEWLKNQHHGIKSLSRPLLEEENTLLFRTIKRIHYILNVLEEIGYDCSSSKLLY